MDPQQHLEPQLEPQRERPQEGESIWIRGLYMLLFVLIYGVAEGVVVAVAAVRLDAFLR